MTTGIEVCEKRLDRLEDAIEKLTEISSDLNKMLAVQEQRLSQQEKSISGVEISLEKRRIELDEKLNEVYRTMREEDKNIISKLEDIRIEHAKQHEELSDKINYIQKIMWTYMGAFSVILFLISNGSKVIDFFSGLN